MKISGQFNDINGRTVTVEITLPGNSGDRTIGDGVSGLWFTDDPVETVCETTDPFDHVIRHSCTIRLLARDFERQLFSVSCRDAAVSVFRAGKTLFRGFIEPMNFNQDFNSPEDELELNCIDCLSALQYSPYLSAEYGDWDTACLHAGQRSFSDIIAHCLDGLPGAVFQDGSRLNALGASPVFTTAAANESVFMGGEEAEEMTRLQVLEEVLKYLGLHIEQSGGAFRIFDLESRRKGLPTGQWLTLDGTPVGEESGAVVDFSLSNVESDDTRITMEEAFNRISVKCDLEQVEDLILSPLDENNIESPYTGRQKYMTEYSSEGDGNNAKSDFTVMGATGEKGEYHPDEENVRDWYVHVKSNPLWKFPDASGRDSVETLCTGNSWQNRLPDSLVSSGGAALLAFGSIDHKGYMREETKGVYRFIEEKDSSLQSRVSMDNYLVVAVNGNGEASESKALPTDSQLQARCPVAVYSGLSSGAVLSPADDSTTNYIVISGKVLLMPFMKDSCGWAARPHTFDSTAALPLVDCRDNKDGRYYMRRWFMASSPSANPVDTNFKGFMPPADDCPQYLPYSYDTDSTKRSSDTVDKVPVLACMLVVGDKVAVETTPEGAHSSFEWRKYKTREQCADDDEYYAQSFSIGFDPAIEDYLIGQEYDIENNISHSMGIEAEGTAIPIRKADRLSGNVEFKILGPVNTVWGQVTRRHSTWFRHSSFTSSECRVLPMVSSIMMKGFEMKVYSDNAKIETTQGSDLVYVSDTAEGFTNPHEEVVFKICSDLTADERKALGVAATVSPSTVTDLMTGCGLLAVLDAHSGESAKPEQLYVDERYREHSSPKISLIQKIRDIAGNVSALNRYRHPALPGRTFHVMGVSRNLREGWAELNLKEI